jgi:hypothetical protein
MLQHHKENTRDIDTKIPQSRHIGIHSGFYEYLFASQRKTDPTNKYQQIIHNLQNLLTKEESLRSYPINVAGHSLGGALATLFCLYLVLETDTIQPELPVTCITFASPKVGNIQFARAFQELELQKRVVCLRVANHRDIITERPDRLTCWTFCLQDAIFRHVGIELILYPKSFDSKGLYQNKKDVQKLYHIRYPRIRRSRLSQFSDDFFLSLFNTVHCTVSVTCGCCIYDYMKWHSCDEYLSRVENIEHALQCIPMMTIHDLYHRIVSEESQVFTSLIRPTASKSESVNANVK